MPQGVEPFFIGYGVLGVMFLLVLLGWVAPKWVVSEYQRRLAKKDETITALTAALTSLADNYDRLLDRSK